GWERPTKPRVPGVWRRSVAQRPKWWVDQWVAKRSDWRRVSAGVYGMPSLRNSTAPGLALTAVRPGVWAWTFQRVRRRRGVVTSSGNPRFESMDSTLVNCGDRSRHGPRNTKGRPRAALQSKDRRRPTLPDPCRSSTIGATGLDDSVRNGKRYFP